MTIPTLEQIEQRDREADEELEACLPFLAPIARRKQLHAIVIYLRRMGYVPNGGKLAADHESCTWTIVKGEGRGTLSWTPATGYTLQGLAKPDNSDQSTIPAHLIWH